jgi:hypothetical protein
MKILFLLCAVLVLICSLLFCQGKQTETSTPYVDGNGVMRWKGTNEEVSLFGVNYTAPFAYAFRAHKRLGLPIKKAIDLDVAHMARLGLNGFRVHVWDREISDKDGNILANEHLDLFDYLLARLADHGIRSIVTPIAWWGNGWPEPDEQTSGFSQSYPRLELMTNPKAREAERNYLRQFLNHVNPYRKMSYKDDPAIVAIEIINEPTHPENVREVTEYINELTGVLRSSGFTKPIFYNISQNWSQEQANAVTKSDVDGISFQWYPTDLVHGKMLTGNYLINVDHYAIPSDKVVDFGKKAKMVYEFDAADVGASYMYPAIARSFREAGMQFAEMFSYDPVQIAWSNTEYPTHFVNLLYAPSKAVSLMIAAKGFRDLPRMKSFGNFPENVRFGDFHVSYEDDLSELNSATEFIYSNSTVSVPTNARSLKHVGGCGSSSIVNYDGTGAYFLDKLEDGIWKLEVYPDVLWLHDPFGSASMSRQVARLFWQERMIRIALPDLGTQYMAYPLSASNSRSPDTLADRHAVTPGVYILGSNSISRARLKKYLITNEVFLEGLYTPPADSSDVIVVNKSEQCTSSPGRAEFVFQIASERSITNADLYIRRIGWRGFVKHPLKRAGGFDYIALDTSAIVHPGRIEYCVVVEMGNKTMTFPGGIPNKPGAWDFSIDHLWSMTIVGAGEQFVLLDISRDRSDLVFPHYTRALRYSLDYVSGSNNTEIALSPTISFSDEAESSFGAQLSVSGIIAPVRHRLSDFHHVILKARSGQDSLCTLGLVFLMSDGKSCGANVDLQPEWKEIEIPLSAFRTRSALMLPGSYPLFLPKTWNVDEEGRDSKVDLRLLQGMQIVVDPSSTRQTKHKKEIRFELVSIKLEK